MPSLLLRTPPCRALLVALPFVAACGEVVESEPSVSEQGVAAADQLKIGTWNLELFGLPGAGSADDALQVKNAATVIAHERPDILGLEEICDRGRFAELEARLPAYEGISVVDPRVEGGASAYGASLIRPAILFDRAKVAFVSAKAVAEIDPSRAPLEVTLSVKTASGERMDVVVLVAHFHPSATFDSWTRRKAMGDRLKAYLDARHLHDRVVVVGDFNDDVDTSIVEGHPSPFAQLRDDATRYTFTTRALSSAGQGTMTGWPATIDHHLVSNEMAVRFIVGTAWVERPSYIADYRATTSDHYPVFTRYRIGRP